MNDRFDIVTGDPAERTITLTIPENVDYSLALWWVHTAINDLIKTAPKVVEYGGTDEHQGSADLRVIGNNIAELLEWDGVPLAIAMELGCFFYLQGKIGRLIADYQVKRQGKADTLFDASIYIIMMRRLQSTGMWP